MNARSLLVYLGKLIVCGVAYFVGIMLGGMIATLLQLQAPTLPQGVDAQSAARNLILTSPLLALAPALVARGLGGRFWTRAAVLTLLVWIAYTVNTQLEASIFTTMASGMAFSLVDFAVPSILLGIAAAWLFPAQPTAKADTGFWKQRSVGSWIWHFALAAVAFMPVYWVFGMMVIPFTASYYQQGQFGLAMPSVEQIVQTLFVRSVLFLLACLPVFILWQRTRLELFWRLGAALFILVGLVGMISADWMPIYVRLPHTIEIFADEFVYAGILVLLLGRVGQAILSDSKAVHQGAVS